MANNPQTPSTRAEIDDPTVRGLRAAQPPRMGAHGRAFSPLPLPLSPGSSVGFAPPVVGTQLVARLPMDYVRVGT